MAWEHKSQMTAPTVNWNKMVRCREGIELSAFSRRLGPETARCWPLAPRDRFFGEWIDFSAYVMRGHWSVAEGLSHAKLIWDIPKRPSLSFSLPSNEMRRLVTFTFAMLFPVLAHAVGNHLGRAELSVARSRF